MNTVLFVNATIGFSKNLFLVLKVKSINAQILHKFTPKVG